jgi:3-hydroxyisobutyrate dehydrogenase
MAGAIPAATIGRHRMDTIGFVGVGRIGLPICENLIKSGYRVAGYRRSPMPEFEQAGGIRASSPADVGAQADIVFSCLPNDEALDEVVQGENGLVKSAHKGQIVIELGSHPVPVKRRQIAPLAAKGAVFLDGEIGGTPSMVAKRKGAVYLSGDEDACARAKRVAEGFADVCLFLGPFGAASKVKLINNHLVAIHIAAMGEAMAVALRAGIDVELMIKAVANGSGGSAQFAVRAPMAAEKRFLPAQGTPVDFMPYFDMIGELAATTGTATPMLDRARDIMQRAIDSGYGEHDHAALYEVIQAWPRKA